MIEIGSTLREARLRRGLELADVEEATHMRARYLEALENEAFDRLPGAAYARAFLRTYADFLTLDAERFVEAFDEQYPEEALPILPRPTAPPQRRANPKLLALVAMGVFAVLAWGLGRHEGAGPPEASLPPATTRASPPPPRPASSAGPTRRPAAQTAKLVLVAARGRCWLSAHLGSRQGRTLYEGTLHPGDSLRLSGRRLWIRLGAPAALDARLNGRSVPLPGDTANVVVTPRGVRTVPSSSA